MNDPHNSLLEDDFSFPLKPGLASQRISLMATFQIIAPSVPQLEAWLLNHKLLRASALGLLLTLGNTQEKKPSFPLFLYLRCHAFGVAELSVSPASPCFNRIHEEFLNKHFPSCMGTQNIKFFTSNPEDEQKMATSSRYALS